MGLQSVGLQKSQTRLSDQITTNTHIKTVSIPKFEISLMFLVRPLGKRTSEVSYANDGRQGQCESSIQP